MQGFFLSALWGIVVALCTLGVVPFFLVGKGVGFVIPSLVLLLMITPFSRVAVHAVTVGIILDSYALDLTYFHTFRLLGLAVVGFFIFRQWLTNRSLYTGLVLGILMTTIDQLWIVTADLFQGSGGTITGSLRTLFGAYLVHGVLIIVGFTALAFFSKRLSSPIGRGGRSDWYV